MLTYPQLAQFPIVKTRRRRTLVNRAADGRAIKLADPAGEVTEWRLEYSELSDEEAAQLWDFFAKAEGSLNEFLFVDPTANLLAWSDNLAEAVWSKDPMLQVSATRLTNAGAGPQRITQTIGAPAGFVYCFSVYARSAGAASATLIAGETTLEQAVGPEWRRLRLTATVGEATFGLEIPAGGAVEVRGMQVEAQWGASAARVTSRGGVYEGARLRDDSIEMIATDVNRNSCTVTIIHAEHI
jgi:hypothetical protein